MFLPEGVTKYKPIGVELVNLEKLLDSLHQDRFTGYCEFTTGQKRTILLSEQGRIQRTFCLEEGEITFLSPDAALEKCHTSGEVKGVLLPPEIVDVVVRLLFCGPLHQNLSSTFTDFKTLLKSLENDNFTGYVEVGMGGSVHYLSLVEGGPRSALYFSGEQLIKGAEALERIFYDIGVVKAFISVYPLEEVSLAETFLDISKTLLRKYSELKGPIITSQFWKKLSLCAKGLDGVGVGTMEFRLEGLPKDIRRQEKILIPLLRCQIELFNHELGEDTTRNLYFRLLEKVESPMRELFKSAVQNPHLHME